MQETKKQLTAKELFYFTETINPYEYSGVLASEAKKYSTEDLQKIHQKFLIAGYEQAQVKLIDVCNEVINAFEGVPQGRSRVRYDVIKGICDDWKRKYTHKQLLEVAHACLNADFIYRGNVYSLVRNFADAVTGSFV